MLTVKGEVPVISRNNMMMQRAFAAIRTESNIPSMYMGIPYTLYFSPPAVSGKNMNNGIRKSKGNSTGRTICVTGIFEISMRTATISTEQQSAHRLDNILMTRMREKSPAILYLWSQL